MKKFLVLIVLTVMVGVAGAQVKIQKVEASFIANFMRYIKWPEQESMKTFKIGVLGKNQEIFKELNASVNGRSVGYAKIEVIEVESSDQVKDCQVLFVPTGKSSKAKKILGELSHISVLPITEEQHFMPEFAAINFKVQNSKLTFQLNQDVAQGKKISVSSKLAQMAAN